MKTLANNLASNGIGKKRDPSSENIRRHLASYDPLTGLLNRQALIEWLDRTLAVSGSHRKALATLHVDLDRFRSINDLHGHAIGDELLIQASQRFLPFVQAPDVLARIGSDEFVIGLVGGCTPEKAWTLAKQIVEVFRAPFRVEGFQIKIAASVSIALSPADGSTANTLLHASSTAMHRLKQNSRGSICFFEAAMGTDLQARRQLEQELAVATDRNELCLLYQPIVNGRTRKIEMFEALIRWNNSRLGLVSPDMFIPIAESTGLIDQIGRWVIDQACRDAASWSRPWPIAVNVSPAQFQASDLCKVVADALSRHSLPPARLVLEVTEGVLINDLERTLFTLGQLRDMGVVLALDDFGTGYSSLSYLNRFRFDKLKIDKSFIGMLVGCEDALTLTRTIIQLGQALGLSVTAEGVETAAQMSILEGFGCDQIQGYFIGPPAPIGSYDGMCNGAGRLANNGVPAQASTPMDAHGGS